MSEKIVYVTNRGALYYAQQLVEIKHAGMNQRVVRQYDTASHTWLEFPPMSIKEAVAKRSELVLDLAARYKLTGGWTRTLSVNEHHRLGAILSTIGKTGTPAKRLALVAKTFQARSPGKKAAAK